jgi:hypothetical protein
MSLPVVEECWRNLTALCTLVFSCPHHELYIGSIKSIYYKNITRVQFAHTSILAADCKCVVFFFSDNVDWIKLVRFHVPFIVGFLVIGSCRSGNSTIVSEEPVTSSVV